MTTSTLTLTDFLLARIAEDEAVATAATDGPWVAELGWMERDCGKCDEAGPAHEWHCDGVMVHSARHVVVDEWQIGKVDAEHIARHDPARVLAECEAKRRIVGRAVEAGRAADAWTHERLKTDTRSPLPEWSRRDAYAEALSDLAAAFAYHPDYREEWRP